MDFQSRCLGIILFSVIFFMTSCGGGSGDSSSKDFSQNVNDIDYELKRIEIKVEINYQDGDVGRINTNLTSERDLSKESIRRVTQDGQYFLLVNKENADLSISASSNFDTKKERKGEDGCRWRGQTTASGEAAFNKLNFSMKIEGRLEGKDCSTAIEDQYADFVNSEIEGLHLEAIKKIRDSGLLDLDDSKSVRIEIKILGDGK